MLEKDGFISKPKTIIFSPLFLVSHIVLPDQLWDLHAALGVLMPKLLLLFHIHINSVPGLSPGTAQLQLGTQPWQQTKNECYFGFFWFWFVFGDFFYHLALFSDDLRTSGDTRETCGKILMKTWQF